MNQISKSAHTNTREESISLNRKCWWVGVIKGCGLLLLCATSLVQVVADSIKMGAAAVDFTPPAGTPMAGYYYERGADGILDPLFAKVVVLDDGSNRVALIGLDLIGTVRWIVDDARKLIEIRTGIPATNIMISASHTHTAPQLTRTGSREDDFGSQNLLAKSFSEGLPAKIAEAATLAVSNLAPVTVSHSSGRAEGLTWNRRFFMRDGTVGWNPGKLNPEIVRPAGPTDPEIALVVFSGLDTKPVSIYANFSIHFDTVGGTKFSADVAGVLARQLAAATDSNLFTIYTSGTCGDLNHINCSIARKQKGIQEATRISTILAANILEIVETNLRPMTNGLALRCRTERVKLALPPVIEEEVRWARETVSKTGGQRDSHSSKFIDLVRAYKFIDVMERHGRPQEVEIQTFALGDEIAWVALPGEIFVRLGLDIKERSPFRRTIITTLANGSIGYIPDRIAWSQGNYEVESARVAEGAGEILVDVALRQLRELHREAISHSSSKRD